MIRTVFKQSLTFCAILPIEFNKNLSADTLAGNTPTEKKINQTQIKTESGWDRVKQIFYADEFGAWSMELNTICQACYMSMFVGALYGGFMSSRTAYMDFMRNNQATVFKDHIAAKRQIHDAVTTSFAKGAFRWGWRLTVFTTTFMTISTLVNAYRGKTSVVEYVSAGAASGFVYKFKQGPRAWVVGSGLGATLGLFAGGITLLLLGVTGLSMEEVRYWQNHWYEQRSEKIKEVIAKQMEQEELEVIRMHNAKIGEEGKSLDNLEKPSANVNVIVN